MNITKEQMDAAVKAVTEKFLPEDRGTGALRAVREMIEVALPHLLPESWVLVPRVTLESIRDSSSDPVARGTAHGALTSSINKECS